MKAGASLDARVVLLLSLASASSLASMRVCDSLLPLLAAEFGTTSGEAAHVISGFAISYGLLQLFFGPLGDHYGKVRMIGIATLACTAGNAGAAMSQSMESLVLCRMLSGAAAAGIVPLTMAWIGDNVDYENRQEVLARLLSATVLGMIGGQWAGAVIADHLGWRTAFALLATLFLACGLTLVFESRKHPEVPHVHAGGFVSRAKVVVGSPWARTVLLVTMIEGALVFGALTFVPSYLQLRFGLSASGAGAIVALYGAGGLVYSRTARQILRRLGEAGLAKLGGACMALAFGTIAFSPSWPPIMAACLIAGFGYYALHNTLQTNATQMAPTARGTAVALFACVLFLGQSAGISAAAYLFDHWSSAYVFASAAAGLMALAFAFGRLARRKAPVQ